MGTYTYAQLEGLWINNGGPIAVAPIAAAIALAESSGSDVIQKGQPYKTTGWGLWQITPGNSVPSVGVDNALLDPNKNAQAAVAKFKAAGNSFSPWTTYTSGAYRQFLQQGVQAQEPPGGTSGPENIGSSNVSCAQGFSDQSLYTYGEAVLSFFGGNFTLEHYMLIAAWSSCEGPAKDQGGFNPFNTTLSGNSYPRDPTKPSLPNTPNVANYKDWATGVNATVQSIKNLNIAGVLSQPNSTANAIAFVVGASGWGTSGACMVTKIAEYVANPQKLCADLAQPINTLGTNQGGSSSGADPGAANPIGFGSLVPGLSSLLGPLGKILGEISTLKFWIRAGMMALGLLFIIIGVSFVLSESDTAKSAASTAAVAAIA